MSEQVAGHGEKMGYSKPSSTLPSSLKFKCAVMGEKRSSPCEGCKNTNACMTDGLQIKEPIVENITEKSVVTIDADGVVKSCPKGDASQCGYKPGAKVCGKCGAMASEVKFVPGASSETDAEAMEFAKFKGGYCKCDKFVKGDNGMCANCGMPEAPETDEDEDEDMPAEKGAFNQGMSHVDDPMDEDFKARRKARHKKRMASMGMKSEFGESDSIGDDSEYFLCAATREVKSLSAHSPCADCTGGCVSTGARPDLLEVEAMAEDMLGGKVLFSAYGDEFDMFAVQMRRKDDQAIEIYFTGDGELDGWLRIPESAVYTKDANVIDMATAVNVALSTVQGKALAIAVGRFEEQEAFLVDVDGLDGKSYEIAIAPNGTVMGLGERIIEEKREFSTEEREELAEEGEALPDGSYPIENEEDLKNAIMAFGRAKDKAKAKAHIMKRAKELGLENLIPENWMGGEKSALVEDDEIIESTQDGTDDPEVIAALLELELLEVDSELDSLLGND